MTPVWANAMYESRCGNCDRPIREGDEIGMIDDEWCCKACVEKEDEE